MVTFNDLNANFASSRINMEGLLSTIEFKYLHNINLHDEDIK